MLKVSAGDPQNLFSVAVKFRSQTVSQLAAALVAINALATVRAGTLSGGYAAVAEGSVVDLTAEGKLDWVHWGLYTDSSLNRKSDVVPQISDFRPLDAPTGYVFIYQYADNFNGYSWSDGYPALSVTNTPTGVWAYGTPLIGSGFEITAPADLSTRILKVYVGVYAGLGHFEAHLSDESASSYTNASLMNIRNGPGRVYTLQYSASSSGQRIIVRWILSSPRDATGNVTLQAATLTAPNANNPPVVVLTAPTNNADFASGTSIGLAATAGDIDGAISRVEFYDGQNRLGQVASSPYRFLWDGAAPGPHLITAKALDTTGAIRSSLPVEIFVNRDGGTLSGSIGSPPSFVDLTAEGTADWAHWGLVAPPNYDHKAGIAPLIDNFVLIGGNPVLYSNNTSFAWTDGIPHQSEPGTPTGIYMTGISNGFEFAVPADTTPRQLKVYVRLYGAQGNFQAFLTDASAPAYSDTSLDTAYGTIPSLYTLDYTAAGPGEKLIVRFRTHGSYDMDYGNVGLEAATLRGPPDKPVIQILNPTLAGDVFSFSVATDIGRTYTAEYCDDLSVPTWFELTNFPGTGSIVTVQDEHVSPTQRFYRVKAE